MEDEAFSFSTTNERGKAYHRFNSRMNSAHILSILSDGVKVGFEAMHFSSVREIPIANAIVKTAKFAIIARDRRRACDISLIVVIPGAGTGMHMGSYAASTTQAHSCLVPENSRKKLKM